MKYYNYFLIDPLPQQRHMQSLIYFLKNQKKTKCNSNKSGLIARNCTDCAYMTCTVSVSHSFSCLSNHCIGWIRRMRPDGSACHPVLWADRAELVRTGKPQRAWVVSQYSADGFVNRACCSWWDCWLTFGCFLSADTIPNPEEQGKRKTRESTWSVSVQEV